MPEQKQIPEPEDTAGEEELVEEQPAHRVPTSALVLLAITMGGGAVGLVMMEMVDSKPPSFTVVSRSVQDCIADLQKPDATTRKKAAAELKYLNSPEEAVPELVRGMSDSDPSVRKAMAEALAWLGRRASPGFDDLALNLNSLDKGIREDTADILVRIGPEAREAGCRVALIRLRDKDPKMRRTASVQLVRLSTDSMNTLRQLLEATRDPDADVKQLAAYVIEQTRWSPQASSVFAQALDSLTGPVRGQAALFVRRSVLQGNEAIPALREVQKASKGRAYELAGFLADGLDPRFVRAVVGQQAPKNLILSQPRLTWDDGTKTLQGTGFFAVTPDGRIAAITSNHLLPVNGPRLEEVDFLDVRNGKQRAKLTKSWGKLGNAGVLTPEIDLRDDYLIMPAPDDVKKSALLLDPRPIVERGEPIWFPDKDPKQSNGYRVISGKVTETGNGYIGVGLDENIARESQSGSPVISQWTGRVIGVASRITESDGKSKLLLTPVGSIVDVLLKETTEPELSQVTGKK